MKPQKPIGSGDLGRSAFPRLAGRRRDIHLRDRDRRREAQLAGQQDRLRDAVRHDHGVNFLCDVGRHLSAGRPTLHEALGISLPEDVPLDLDEAHDGLRRMVVRGESEIDGGLPIAEFRDQGDGAVVVDPQIDPAVRWLHEPTAIDVRELEGADGHLWSRLMGGRYFKVRGLGF